MPNKVTLTIQLLQKEAASFAEVESTYPEPSLYGVTDGKAVGTYLEHKFQAYLHEKYEYVEGSSAMGIDFPELGVDVKTTSCRQPQSSCPYKSAKQKVYGLGYNLLVFVYEKSDNETNRTGTLNILHTIFVEEHRTADYQMTRGLLELLDRDANVDDLMAFMFDKNLPLDEIATKNLAEELLDKRPEQGYLTISNALQWRLQYGRIVGVAGQIEGIHKVR